MKEAGLDAEQIWAEAEASGVNQIVLFRMLKEVFGLSFPEAKAVCVRARTGTSLEEHAIRLCDAIENAVEEK